jgi:hypothetical protein
MGARATSTALSSVVLGGWLTAATAHGAAVGAPQAPSWAQDQARDQQTVDTGDTVGVIPQPSIDSPGTVMGVTLGELYTDNLGLAGPGEPTQSSWITEIQPFFKWARSGPRFAGVVDYKLTGYLYAGQSHSSQLAQDLRANGTFVLIPQHLFIDGLASYGREVINNELPSGSGTFFLDNNHLNVGAAALSPYWVQDLGRVGTMTLRYSVGRVVYDHRGIPGQNAALSSGIPNVTGKGVEFNLESPADQTWGWNLGYSEQRIDPDFGPGIEYAMGKLGTSWQVSNNTRLLADAGKESRFLPDGTTQKLGATFWDVGFDWSNTRDNLKLLVGHRFYGRSYQFSWGHTAALLTTNLSYMEQPTDLNQQLLGQSRGQAINLPLGTPRLPSLRERQVYLMKRAAASATYTMPSSRLRLALYDERRTYFALDSRQEKVANGDIAWQFDIGALTTITPTFGWQRYHFQDGQTSYNHYSQLEFVHQVNPENFGSLRLRRDSRSVYSEVPGAHGYRVNVVFVQWTHLF